MTQLDPPALRALPKKPAHLDEMLRLSAGLSEGIPHVRVDWYDIGETPLFGEMTFYDGSGMCAFARNVDDELLGSWVKLGWRGASVNEGRIIQLSGSTAKVGAPVGVTDYKFYCFNGEPQFLYVSKGLEDHKTARISFVSLDWEFEPFSRGDYMPFEELSQKPAHFDDMIKHAKILANGMPFVRVDFYEHAGRDIFSEMTFFPCSGYMNFSPQQWDEKVGGMLDLPRKLYTAT